MRTNVRESPGIGPARSSLFFASTIDSHCAGDARAVLGATSGIGRAVAIALAEAGADVIVHGRTSARADAKLDLLWSVDVAATIRLCREVGRRMKAQGHGAS